MKLVRDILNLRLVVIASIAIGLCGLELHAQDLSNGLVAYFTFECNANDITGNGHDATIIGSPVCESGKYGQAYRLNGEDQYFELQKEKSLEYISANGFTWSLWFKGDDIPTTASNSIKQTLMSVCNDKLNHDVIFGFGTFQSPQNKIAFEVDGNEGPGQAMSPLTHRPVAGFQNDVWYHIIGVRDYANNKVHLYVDGVLVDTDDVTEPALTDITMLASIGVFNEGDDIRGYFEGMIDDVRIYNRPLTPEECELLPTLNPDQLEPETKNLEIDLRCNTDTTAVLKLTNIGPGDFGIKSTSLTQGTYFSIENPKDTLLKDQEFVDLKINFQASNPGTYYDTLVVENLNQVLPLTVYLVGNKDEVRFEYNATYDLDKVLIGEFKDSIIAIANNGSLPIFINGFTNSANFEVVDSKPPLSGQIEIPAGDTLWVTVRFTAVKGVFDESIFINAETPCGEIDYEMNIIAEGAYQADIDIELSQVEVETGDYFDLQVKMTRAVDIEKAELTRLNAEIKTNQTITVLKSDDFTFTVEGSYLIIPVVLEMETAKDGDILATLNFRATLGMVAEDDIVLQNIVPEGGLAKINLQDGHIKLTDICDDGQGGIRLIDASEQLSLSPIYPNPTKNDVVFEFSTIEPGTTQVYIINSNGDKVAEIINDYLKVDQYSIPYDLSGLPPGAYFYILETPTQILSRKMQISR
jgi:concanavalin A-like lectin/glucanase superfamily protein/type IX secretion system substrate protein